ncbi:hypothetical protein LguiA_007697 [Lonicera macranthoides]
MAMVRGGHHILRVPHLFVKFRVGKGSVLLGALTLWFQRYDLYNEYIISTKFHVKVNLETRNVDKIFHMRYRAKFIAEASIKRRVRDVGLNPSSLIGILADHMELWRLFKTFIYLTNTKRYVMFVVPAGTRVGSGPPVRTHSNDTIPNLNIFGPQKSIPSINLAKFLPAQTTAKQSLKSCPELCAMHPDPEAAPKASILFCFNPRRIATQGVSRGLLRKVARSSVGLSMIRASLLEMCPGLSKN